MAPGCLKELYYSFLLYMSHLRASALNTNFLTLASNPKPQYPVRLLPTFSLGADPIGSTCQTCPFLSSSSVTTEVQAAAISSLRDCSLQIVLPASIPTCLVCSTYW